MKILNYFLVLLLAHPSGQDNTPPPPGTKVEMVVIPVGAFRMSNPHKDQGEKGEYPAHEVSLPAFWMSKYGITQAQYNRLLISGLKKSHPAKSNNATA